MINASGSARLLYKFCSQSNCSDGATPSGGLIQASDGNFYGVTLYGGVGNSGTVFKITPAGALTTLYSFCSEQNCADGQYPVGQLLQATDRNFYGSTGFGGDPTCNPQPPSGCGTIFQITPSGVVTTPYSFDTRVVNSSALFQATSGVLYGTTVNGGNPFCGFGCGTVYSLDMGLGPFVAFVHNSAKAGQKFGILGQGFTGTSNVSFNGISAHFTVVSDTIITATVPAGATTGYVTVTTPSGTQTSNVPFQVIP